MTIARKCNLCGLIEDGVFSNNDLCDDCELNMSRVQSEANNEAYIRVKTEFSLAVAGRVGIMSLLAHIDTLDKKSLTNFLGEQGYRLFQKARTGQGSLTEPRIKKLNKDPIMEETLTKDKE